MSGLPRPDERVVFIGPTGSGKTYLAQHMLSKYQQVVVIDAKHDSKTWSKWEKNKAVIKAGSLSQLERGLNEMRKGGGAVLYRPPFEHLRASGVEGIDVVFELAFRRGDTIVYIDDLVLLARNSAAFAKLPSYQDCVTCGRSKGVAIWSSIQRPARVPLISMTESEHQFAFYLRNGDDRRTTDDVLGDDPPVNWSQLRALKYSYMWGTNEALRGPFIFSTSAGTLSKAS
jgi:energy-coupling factor transporter ATP-binding protein EcfA2